MQLEDHQLTALQAVLKRELPRSFKVFGNLTSYLRGRWPDETYWVDSWPEFKVVLSRSFLDMSDDNQQTHMTSIGVFARDAAALPGMIEKVVDWRGPVEFTAIQEGLHPMTEQAGREKGMQMVSSMKAHLYDVTSSTLVQWPVPAGFKVSHMTADDVDAIVGTWKHHTPGTEKYLQHLVSSFPSVCLHDNDGRKVGHELCYQHVSPGMLLVEHQFRGQGHGKVIVSQMARLLLEENDVVFATVEEGNDRGRWVHEACGFNKVPDFVCSWQSFR